MIIRHMLSFKWNGDRSDYHINRATLSYSLDTIISGIKLFPTPDSHPDLEKRPHVHRAKIIPVVLD